MKSSIRKNTFKAIYRLLDRVSPVDFDCGRLCGSACCTCDNGEGEDELGIYLLPGEEKLFTRHEDWLRWSVEKAEDYDFPESWHGNVFFVRCLTPPVCERHMRPIQCRTYPLAPHIDEDGTLRLILSTFDVPYECPLIEAGRLDKDTIDQRFIRATYTAWKHLIRDEYIYDLICQDSDDRVEDNADIVYIK